MYSPLVVVVMILFYQKDGSLYFPLIQRPDYDGVHAKQMSFPGGKKDAGDSSLMVTAIRETQEEIGIESSKIIVIGALTELFIIASNFNVLPVIGYVNEPPTLVADEHEVDEITNDRTFFLMTGFTQAGSIIFLY